MRFLRTARSALLVLSVLAGVSAARAVEPGSLKFPDATLEPAGWSDLDGWASEYTATSAKPKPATAKKSAKTAARRQ